MVTGLVYVYAPACSFQCVHELSPEEAGHDFVECA